MIAAGEHDAFDALDAGRLEQIVRADDVGAEDRVPVAFDGKVAQVNDAVDPGDGGSAGRPIAQVGLDERLIGPAIVQGDDVGQAQALAPFELPAQEAPDAAGGAGQ